MSLDVGRALTGGNITKSTVSDFICDMFNFNKRHQQIHLLKPSAANIC